MKAMTKKRRESNLELYRIIVMLMIVAHHYVVNSGLFELIGESPVSPSSLVMLVFGGWGKTGINCFVLITGWFMCRSEWTWKKLVKLYLQVVFYSILIYTIFCLTGKDTFSITKTLGLVWPVREIHSNFVSCFIVWYLFIPFFNILIGNLSKNLMGYLTVLLLSLYCFLPQIPGFHIGFNYVSWFTVLYFVAAYIRIYGFPIRITHKQWGIIAICCIIGGGMSIMILELLNKMYLDFNIYTYWFMSDSNRVFPLFIALSSFMWFKDVKIPYSKWINAIGGATFGVLLIHANSDTMRQWLWCETVDCMGHYGESLIWTLGYAGISVLVIFFVCSGMDWFRGKYIEPLYLPRCEKALKSFASWLEGKMKS